MPLSPNPNHAARTFRVAAAALCALAAVPALWLGSADALHGTRSPDLETAPVAAASLQDRFARAARVAWLNGRFWTDAALARAIPLLANASAGATVPTAATSAEQALSEARRAVALSPLDGRAWLLLAVLPPPAGAPPADAAQALKMTYYVSPSDPALIPARLRAVMALAPVPDAELRDLFRFEVQTIVSRRPELRDALARAYRGAPAQGRTTVDDIIKDSDPAFLEVLRAADKS